MESLILQIPFLAEIFISSYVSAKFSLWIDDHLMGSSALFPWREMLSQNRFFLFPPVVSRRFSISSGFKGTASFEPSPDTTAELSNAPHAIKRGFK
jgi:hypothetical protein